MSEFEIEIRSWSNARLRDALPHWKQVGEEAVSQCEAWGRRDSDLLRQWPNARGLIDNPSYRHWSATANQWETIQRIAAERGIPLP